MQFPWKLCFPRSQLGKNEGISRSRTIWSAILGIKRHSHDSCRRCLERFQSVSGAETGPVGDSRLLPAVLGAFSSKCVLCGWDASRRSEIRKALKSAEGVMFPMPELEGWVGMNRGDRLQSDRGHGLHIDCGVCPGKMRYQWNRNNDLLIWRKAVGLR